MGLGEYRFGAAHGYRHVLYVKASHGIGAGLLLDGQLYRGASLAAPKVVRTAIARLAGYLKRVPAGIAPA